MEELEASLYIADEVEMKDEILGQIRSFLFPDALAKVSRMLDQYKESIEQSAPMNNRDDNRALLDDQFGHLMRALTMISKVPDSAEGAKMARGLAEEAISVMSHER